MDVIGTVAINNEEITLLATSYGNSKLAVVAMMPDGQQYGTLSVNMPNDLMPPGVFRMKAWSENARLAEAAINSGLFEPVDLPLAHSGFVSAEAWRIK